MIELENIHSYYGTSHILQGIDLVVERRRSRQLTGS